MKRVSPRPVGAVVELLSDEELKEKTNASYHYKTRAGKIVKDVMNVLNYREESVSVAIEEIKLQDWAEKVYKPDIVEKPAEIYKKPGYTM